MELNVAGVVSKIVLWISESMRNWSLKKFEKVRRIQFEDWKKKNQKTMKEVPSWQMKKKIIVAKQGKFEFEKKKKKKEKN